MNKPATPNSLIEALRWALEWIDAVPPDTVLPAMPGFDRDYVNDLLDRAQRPSSLAPTVAGSVDTLGERAAFEAWIKTTPEWDSDYDEFMLRADGQYDDMRWRNAYEAWEARARHAAAAPREWAAIQELLALLVESQGSIGGDWRARRDAAVSKAQKHPTPSSPTAPVQQAQAVPEGDALDAQRWRALLNSERIRMIGSAGITRPEPNNYAHFGMEIWTTYGRDYTPLLLAEMDQGNQKGREWLTKYADIAIAAQVAANKQEGK